MQAWNDCRCSALKMACLYNNPGWLWFSVYVQGSRVWNHFMCQTTCPDHGHNVRLPCSLLCRTSGGGEWGREAVWNTPACMLVVALQHLPAGQGSP